MSFEWQHSCNAPKSFPNGLWNIFREVKGAFCPDCILWTFLTTEKSKWMSRETRCEHVLDKPLWPNLTFSVPANSWPSSTYRSVSCSCCFVYLTQAWLESIRKTSVGSPLLFQVDRALKFPSCASTNCQFATLKTPAAIHQSRLPGDTGESVSFAFFIVTILVHIVQFLK